MRILSPFHWSNDKAQKFTKSPKEEKMIRTKWYAKTVHLLVALVLSLGLVTAVPVSAVVTAATVTVAPTTVNTAAQYTILS